MVTIGRSICLGCLVLLANVASAYAGDVIMRGGLKDMVADEPVYMVPVPSGVRKTASWYIRGDVAYAFHTEPEMVEDFTYDLTSEDYDDTWTIGGGIGRYLTSRIRGDITVDYRFETDLSGFNPAGPGAPFGGGTRNVDVSQLLMLANVYYDFPSYRGGGMKDGYYRARYTPYIGLGLGFVAHWSDEGTVTGCGCTGTIGSEHGMEVAAAFMAGVGINVRDRYMLDAGYRYLYMGGFDTGIVQSPSVISGRIHVDDIHAHEFRLGLRYDVR